MLLHDYDYTATAVSYFWLCFYDMVPRMVDKTLN